MVTDEVQETIVNEALRKFVHYLNLWWNADFPDEPDPYTIEKFTVDDSERGLYGWTDWRVLEEPVEGNFFQTALIKIDTDDGDEGGGSQLYVGLEGGHNAPLAIHWIVHIFDLQPTFIYSAEEGYRAPPEGQMVKEN